MVAVARTIVNTPKTINGVPNTKTFTTTYDSKGNVLSSTTSTPSSTPSNPVLVNARTGERKEIVVQTGGFNPPGSQMNEIVQGVTVGNQTGSYNKQTGVFTSDKGFQMSVSPENVYRPPTAAERYVQEQNFRTTGGAYIGTQGQLYSSNLSPDQLGLKVGVEAPKDYLGAKKGLIPFASTVKGNIFAQPIKIAGSEQTNYVALQGIAQPIIQQGKVDVFANRIQAQQEALKQQQQNESFNTRVFGGTQQTALKDIVSEKKQKELVGQEFRLASQEVGNKLVKGDIIGGGLAGSYALLTGLKEAGTVAQISGRNLMRASGYEVQDKSLIEKTNLLDVKSLPSKGAYFLGAGFSGFGSATSLLSGVARDLPVIAVAGVLKVPGVVGGIISNPTGASLGATRGIVGFTGGVITSIGTSLSGDPLKFGGEFVGGTAAFGLAGKSVGLVKGALGDIKNIGVKKVSIEKVLTKEQAAQLKAQGKIGLPQERGVSKLMKEYQVGEPQKFLKDTLKLPKEKPVGLRTSTFELQTGEKAGIPTFRFEERGIYTGPKVSGIGLPQFGRDSMQYRFSLLPKVDVSPNGMIQAIVGKGSKKLTDLSYKNISFKQYLDLRKSTGIDLTKLGKAKFDVYLGKRITIKKGISIAEQEFGKIKAGGRSFRMEELQISLTNEKAFTKIGAELQKAFVPATTKPGYFSPSIPYSLSGGGEAEQLIRPTANTYFKEFFPKNVVSKFLNRPDIVFKKGLKSASGKVYEVVVPGKGVSTKGLLSSKELSKKELSAFAKYEKATGLKVRDYLSSGRALPRVGFVSPLPGFLGVSSVSSKVGSISSSVPSFFSSLSSASVPISSKSSIGSSVPSVSSSISSGSSRVSSGSNKVSSESSISSSVPSSLSSGSSKVPSITSSLTSGSSKVGSILSPITSRGSSISKSISRISRSTSSVPSLSKSTPSYPTRTSYRQPSLRSNKYSFKENKYSYSKFSSNLSGSKQPSFSRKDFSLSGGQQPRLNVKEKFVAARNNWSGSSKYNDKLDFNNSIGMKNRSNQIGLIKNDFSITNLFKNKKDYSTSFNRAKATIKGMSSAKNKYVYSNNYLVKTKGYSNSTQYKDTDLFNKKEIL